MPLCALYTSQRVTAEDTIAWADYDYWAGQIMSFDTSGARNMFDKSDRAINAL